MRILYHHRTLADGAEGIHIAEMVSAFRNLGHEVHVCGLAGSEKDAGRQGLVHRLKQLLPRAAFEVASVSSNVVDYLDVRRTIRNFHPDFLYKRHARLDVGALMAARHAGIPAVLEINCLFTGAQYHEFEPMSLGRAAATLERRAMTLADVVLAVSTPLARQIEAASGISPVVMPNGADPVRFDPKRTDGTGVRSKHALGSGLVVGWAGVMRDWHGLDLLVNALAQLPDLALLIVGDGPARRSVERHAAACGVLSRMAITGRVASADMPEYLAAMDIAVVASDGTAVASPMKLLEYMSMERPVVAPRLDNIRDLVTDEHDGLLFTPGDAADLARVLGRLANDEALRARLGHEARRTIQGAHNWGTNAARVLALVEQRKTTSPRRAPLVHRSL